LKGFLCVYYKENAYRYDDDMQSIGAFINEAVAEGAFPGSVWLIGSREKILEQGAAGIMGKELGQVKQDTLYDLASLTKIIVTLALVRQFQEGLMGLEDTIDRFIPAYQNTPKGKITLFALLTHTSSIPARSNYYLKCARREELLEAIRLGTERNDSPGRVEYTCEGFIVLGEIIAAIDGASLDEAIRRRVLEPLGMNDTRFKPPVSLLDRIAPTEDCPWRGRLVRGEVHDENAALMGGVSGNAGLFSTAADIAKVGRAMLGVSMTDEPFLQKAVIKMMTTNYTAGKGDDRGLGWQLASSGPASGLAAGDLMSSGSFGHTGFTGTSLWIDPMRGLYGVLLSNRIYPTRDNERIFRVRRIFHNLMILRYGGCI
jgi:CubicO group peptidase (beta-lactamase class C family)